MEEDAETRMDQDVVPEHPPPEGKDENNKCFYLFNCDTTYKLDAVEKLLKAIKEKLNFNIKISEKKYFRLFEMAELCETVLSGPPMDVAIFAVHAHESRLSINEDNAGIGYAKFYRALLQAAGERVIVIIGGDDNYRGAAEEEKAVLSRWAKRQISSQFKEEFIDGQKSFIFSWNKKHRAIHEEALLHFLDPAKKGTKFVYEPKQPQTTPSVDTNQQADTSKESSEVDVEGKPQINYPTVQLVENGSNKSQPAESRLEPEKPLVYQPDQPTDSQEKLISEETMQPVPEGTSEEHSAFKPEFVCSNELETIVNDTLSQGEKPVAILCRDKSDTMIIEDVFGDVLLGKVHIFSDPPDALPKSLRSSHSVRSCVIVVDARTIEEELHRKSVETPYENLLVAAREAVEQKVVVIVCSDKGKTSHNEEDTITERIKQILGEKGVVLWRKDNEHSLVETKGRKRALQLNRSKSLPDDGVAKKSVGTKPRPINPEEFTLLLKTRLHHGRISYKDKDVLERQQGWTAPDYLENDLKEKWHSVADAELLIYREHNTSNLHAVVNPAEKKFRDNVKGAFQRAGDYLSSELENIGTSISGVMSEDFLSLN